MAFDKTVVTLRKQPSDCQRVIDFFCADWGEEEEDQADKQLWEDNWDDDNVEDDFSVQLR